MAHLWGTVLRHVYEWSSGGLSGVFRHSTFKACVRAANWSHTVYQYVEMANTLVISAHEIDLFVPYHAGIPENTY